MSRALTSAVVAALALGCELPDSDEGTSGGSRALPDPDGYAPAPPPPDVAPKLAWIDRFGGAGAVAVGGRVLGDGLLHAAGSFRGHDADVFLATWAPDGARTSFVWQPTSDRAENVFRAVLDDAGNAFVLYQATPAELRLSRRGPGGAVSWDVLLPFGGSVADLERDPTGGVVVVGNLPSASGGTEPFVKKLGPDGTLAWATPLAGAGFAGVTAVTVSPAGTVYAFGVVPPVVQTGIRFARLDPAGNVQAVSSVPAPLGAPVDAAVGPGGEVYLVGTIANVTGAFVLRLDAAGTVVWDEIVPQVLAEAIEVGCAGRVLLGGIPFPGAPGAPAPGDPFVRVLDPRSGATLGTATFAVGGTEERITDLAAGPGGVVYALGRALDPAGADEAFVAKLGSCP